MVIQVYSICDFFMYYTYFIKYTLVRENYFLWKKNQDIKFANEDKKIYKFDWEIYLYVKLFSMEK